MKPFEYFISELEKDEVKNVAIAILIDPELNNEEFTRTLLSLVSCEVILGESQNEVVLKSEEDREEYRTINGRHEYKRIVRIINKPVVDMRASDLVDTYILAESLEDYLKNHGVENTMIGVQSLEEWGPEFGDLKRESQLLKGHWQVKGVVPLEFVERAVGLANHRVVSAYMHRLEEKSTS